MPTSARLAASSTRASWADRLGREGRKALQVWLYQSVWPQHSLQMQHAMHGEDLDFSSENRTHCSVCSVSARVLSGLALPFVRLPPGMDQLLSL